MSELDRLRDRINYLSRRLVEQRLRGREGTRAYKGMESERLSKMEQLRGLERKKLTEWHGGKES